MASPYSSDHEEVDDLETPSKKKREEIRIWVGGCFDLLHYGHASALRQAKRMGDYLVVGVHSDVEIRLHKGLPIMNEQERYKMVRSLKWVDEVVEDAPYIVDEESLDKYKCKYSCHADTSSISCHSGEDVFQAVKDCKRYKEFKTTPGVSTTDIVGRMLLLTKTHHNMKPTNGTPQSSNASSVSTGTQVFTTSHMIMDFQEGYYREPEPDDIVVYVAGHFDLFHAGHVDFLKKCREMGTFLIVGLHNDWEVNRYMKRNYPIMNLHERVLSTLACRYVSDVIIGAPYVVSDQLLDQCKINIVVHGNTPIKPAKDGSNPYAIPKQRGIFKIINTGNTLVTDDIVQRIIRNRLEYQRRNDAKEAKELRIIKRASQSESSESS